MFIIIPSNPQDKRKLLMIEFHPKMHLQPWLKAVLSGNYLEMIVIWLI